MPAHAITLRQFCSGILGSGDLESKLTPPRGRGGLPLDDTHPGKPLYINFPTRDQSLKMVNGLPPLPRPSALQSPEARATCLARFAHHELMAVELFAWALLRWPDLPAELRREFAVTIADEQRHCRLYLDRLEALGSSFYDHPRSDYFWRHVPAIASSPHGPCAFLAAMGLTLEQANLDFTLLYRDAFRAAGDEESANIVQQVHDDEVRHVATAGRWIRILGPPGADTIEAYSEAVPFPLSAARAKGRRFDAQGRRQAGLDEPFIEFIRRARSNQEQRRRSAAKAERTNPGEDEGPLLFPNVGAEEIPGKGGVVTTAATAPTLRLWRLLFPHTARFMVPRVPGEPRKLIQALNGDLRWPEALGEPTDAPAFPWLESATGIVPWLASARVLSHPSYSGQEIYAASPGDVARVHDKAFAVRIGREQHLLPQEISDLLLVLDTETLRDPDRAIAEMKDAVARWPAWVGKNFTLKPRLGASGRGRVPGVDGNPDSSAVRGALKRMIRKGGAILEPWFERTIDLSAQMLVSPEGEVTLLGTLEQIVARSGVFIGHRAEIDSRGRVFSGTRYDEDLREAAVAVALAARREGFHGPCGVDAFALKAQDVEGRDREIFRPIVEFNARFTMGTIAIGLLRRALPLVKAPLDLAPGKRCAFYFGLKEPRAGWQASADAIRGRKLLLPLGHPEDELQPAMLFAENREELDAVIEATTTSPKSS